MSANDIIDTGTILPSMATAQPLPGFVVRVVWNEGDRAGREDLVDLRPIIHSYKVYRPLRDEALFLAGKLADDGETIDWGREDLEMSADMVLSLAEEAMRPHDFSAFLLRNKLTQEAAAALLGRSRRQIANYTSAGPVPRIVALACYGYEARKRDVTITSELQSSAEELRVPDSKRVTRV
jgi:hypothetical protein